MIIHKSNKNYEAIKYEVAKYYVHRCYNDDDIRFYLEHAEGPILEIGSGTGRLTRPLIENGHIVTAVEKSLGRVRFFMESLEKEQPASLQMVTLLGLDRHDIDFPAQSYQSIFLHHRTFQHLLMVDPLCFHKLLPSYILS